MIRPAILAALLAACGSSPVAPDAPPADAAPMPRDAPLCFGRDGYCFTTAPNGDLVLRDTLDTFGDPRCTADRTDVCLIGATNLVVSQRLTLTSSRPLVLAGVHVIVDGVIDLSQLGGASLDCPGNTAPGTRGGYAGGTFVTRGGNGGASSAGVGGIASAAVAPTTLRGGCPGGGKVTGDTFGHAGGAIALVATDAIEIYTGSRINASGGGGGPTLAMPNGTGGLGGGSGGMVVLDAPRIVVDGNIAANGGGGSEGSSSTTDGFPGAAGSNGAGQVATPAPGGSGGTGANGGSGAAGTSAAVVGSPSGSTSGGGGGGGGAGAVVIHGTVSGAGLISPPAMTN